MTINLYNRYGDKVYLEYLKDNKWVLKFGSENQSSYCRVIYNVKEDDTRTINAVDPSGGPYLCVGYVVEKKTVTKIEESKGEGFIFTLEPLHK